METGASPAPVRGWSCVASDGWLVRDRRLSQTDPVVLSSAATAAAADSLRVTGGTLPGRAVAVGRRSVVRSPSAHAAGRGGLSTRGERPDALREEFGGARGSVVGPSSSLVVVASPRGEPSDALREESPGRGMVTGRRRRRRRVLRSVVAATPRRRCLNSSVCSLTRSFVSSPPSPSWAEGVKLWPSGAADCPLPSVPSGNGGRG